MRPWLLAYAASLLGAAFGFGPHVQAGEATLDGPPAPAPSVASAASTARGLPVRVLAAPPQVVGDTARWRSRIEAIFVEGALFDEAKRERGVIKFDKGIDLSLRGDAVPDFLPFAEALGDELSELIGLPVELHAQNNWAGNVDVYITRFKAYWPFFVQAVDPDDTAFTCSATPWAFDGQIKRSQIHINAGNLTEAEARACLVEEVVQSLGLFGEVPDRASLLNDEVGYEGLGQVDRLLLQVLYDPRLEPGMGAEQARPIARDLIDERLSALPPTS